MTLPEPPIFTGWSQAFEDASDLDAIIAQDRKEGFATRREIALNLHTKVSSEKFLLMWDRLDKAGRITSRLGYRRRRNGRRYPVTVYRLDPEPPDG